MRWYIAAVAAVAALPIAAHAESRVRYTYAEVGYVNVDVHRGDINGGGFALRGSYALPTAPLFLYGELADADLDFGRNFTDVELGLGGHLAIENGIDLIGRVGIDNLDIERGINDDGFALALGLRGKATGNFEFEGLVRYVDLGSRFDNTSLRGEGRYFFSPNGSVGVQLELGDEITTFGVFGRWTF